MKRRPPFKPLTPGAFDLEFVGALSLALFKGGVLGLLVLEQIFLLPKKRFQFGSHRSRALM
jgi:hypothetical protein